jgi:hypothetical protein
MMNIPWRINGCYAFGIVRLSFAELSAVSIKVEQGLD